MKKRNVRSDSKSNRSREEDTDINCSASIIERYLYISLRRLAGHCNKNDMNVEATPLYTPCYSTITVSYCYVMLGLTYRKDMLHDWSWCNRPAFLCVAGAGNSDCNQWWGYLLMSSVLFSSLRTSLGK